ncbi:hypothetical protein [Enterococcus gilvus]|uniref:hypothetical protein n=1 Tax=Enterococcus gilvus TaxID=160453 RepID=UPI00290A6293|nr:hypothetical protein [Enterococcus gilvus]MDU5509871.1 hypothetical protein [Enterococcus gilvus]
MDAFKELFTPAQQFLMLQAYVDSKLTEEELMNFSLLESTKEVPVVFYSAGVMVIQPALDLGDFTHAFFSKEQLEIRRQDRELILELPGQAVRFGFEDREEAQQVEKDFAYLYTNPE